MFLLKKILGSLLLPLPLCLLVSFLGLFLLWRGKRELTGKVLVTIGLVALTILSYGPVSRALNATLDCRFEVYKTNSGSQRAVKTGKRVKYIVVLAGGHNSDPSIPISGRLYCHPLIRLMEGIRVFRQNPGSRLVLSGCGAFDPVPEANVLADVARFLGIDKKDMILESGSYDTKDQARLIKQIVGSQPFVLVTSAIHMPRSMALFRKQGMYPIPAPAGQTARARQSLTPGSFFPNSTSLENSSNAFHEYLGLIWARLRGQI